MWTSPKLIAPFHMLRAIACSSLWVCYSPTTPVTGNTMPVM